MSKETIVSTKTVFTLLRIQAKNVFFVELGVPNLPESLNKFELIWRSSRKN